MSSQLTYQGVPPITTPLMNPDGTMNMAWYRFFYSLLVKTGLGVAPNQGTVNRIGVQSSAGRKISSTLYPGGDNASTAIGLDVDYYLNVYDVITGQFLGRVKFTDTFGP